MVSCGAVLFQWRPRFRITTVCNLASPTPTVTAEQLRQQLDTLHKEADSTRIKGQISYSIHETVFSFFVPYFRGFVHEIDVAAARIFVANS